MIAQRDDADRQVDEEDPVPADLVGQEAAQRGADEGRDAEHGAEQALVLAALLGREEVADDGQRDREDGAGAEALDAAEERSAGSCPATGRTGTSRTGTALTPNISGVAPAELVGQLAVDRPGDRAREQVDRDHPGVQGVARQVGDDASATRCRRSSGRGRTGRAPSRMAKRICIRARGSIVMFGPLGATAALRARWRSGWHGFHWSTGLLVWQLLVLVGGLSLCDVLV